MPKRRRYASEPFGPAVERLMNETGVTYRALASKTGLSAGYLNHLVHGNRPVRRTTWSSSSQSPSTSSRSFSASTGCG